MINRQTDKKKVLFLDFGPGFGGSVVSLSLLLKYNASRGVSSVVFMSHDDTQSIQTVQRYSEAVCAVRPFYEGKWVQGHIEKIKNKALRWVLIACNIIISLFLNIGFFSRAIFFARKHKVNLIHINCFISLSLYSAVIVFFLRLPCVCHVRTSVRQSLMFRFLIKYVDHFVAISEYVRSQLIDTKIPSEKITVVHPVADWDEFLSPINTKNLPVVDKHQYRVGVFGCLLNWKGQHVLIEAAEYLRKDSRFDDCHFYVVGSSPQGQIDSYEILLRNMVKEKKLENVVHFLGHRNDVAQLILEMDVIVHTSIEPEPFGRIVMESLGLGRPVIATNMGGVPEMITDHENGILIPGDDFKKLGEAVAELLLNEGLRMRLGDSAKKTSQLKFSMRVHDRIFEIYNDLLKRK